MIGNPYSRNNTKPLPEVVAEVKDIDERLKKTNNIHEIYRLNEQKLMPGLFDTDCHRGKGFFHKPW